MQDRGVFRILFELVVIMGNCIKKSAVVRISIGFDKGIVGAIVNSLSLTSVGTCSCVIIFDRLGFIKVRGNSTASNINFASTRLRNVVGRRDSFYTRLANISYSNRSAAFD